MLKNILFLTTMTAFFFAVWPLIVRTTQLHPSWATILVCLGTVIPAFLILKAANPPTMSNLIVGLLAGILNGFGMLAYTKLISMKTAEISKFIPLSVAMMVVFTSVGGVILYREPITLKKLLGVIAAFVAASLLG